MSYVDVNNLRRVFDVSKPWLNRVLEGGHLEFLKAVLPEPGTLGENYTGETSIGCQIRRLGKDGNELTYFVWNNCKHG